MLSTSTSGARAQASRVNGARSRGPRTAEGKARASQNALKHGLCAKKHLLLPDDSRAQFAALAGALLDDLAPEGALQTLLAHRLIAAAWRLARADRIEFELFSRHDAFESGPGQAMIQDGRDARVFPTLVRYRGAAQAEFFRALKALGSAKAEAAETDAVRETGVGQERAPELTVRSPVMPEDSSPDPDLVQSLARETADEVGRRASVSEPEVEATRNEPERRTRARQCDTESTPEEPERDATGERCTTSARRGEPCLADLRNRGGTPLREARNGPERPGGAANGGRRSAGTPEVRSDAAGHVSPHRVEPRAVRLIAAPLADGRP